MSDKQYAERDAWELDKAGGYYMRHVEAMTAEGLHKKSDIAAELAHRDMRIAALAAELAEMTAMRDGFKAACDGFLDDIEAAKSRTVLLRAAISHAKSKLSATQECHPSATRTLAWEAYEILDGTPTETPVADGSRP